MLGRLQGTIRKLLQIDESSSAANNNEEESSTAENIESSTGVENVEFGTSSENLDSSTGADEISSTATNEPMNPPVVETFFDAQDPAGNDFQAKFLNYTANTTAQVSNILALCNITNAEINLANKTRTDKIENIRLDDEYEFDVDAFLNAQNANSTDINATDIFNYETAVYNSSINCLRAMQNLPAADNDNSINWGQVALITVPVALLTLAGALIYRLVTRKNDHKEEAAITILNTADKGDMRLFNSPRYYDQQYDENGKLITFAPKSSKLERLPIPFADSDGAHSREELKEIQPQESAYTRFCMGDIFNTPLFDDNNNFCLFSSSQNTSRRQKQQALAMTPLLGTNEEKKDSSNNNNISNNNVLSDDDKKREDSTSNRINFH